jgi:ketosteroid isomerase-like protein
MQSEESRKLVIEFLTAQGGGDAETMKRLLTDDVEWAPPASVGLDIGRGPEAVVDALANAGRKFFDMASLKVQVRWIAADGDKVIVRQRMQATAANGRPYDNEYVWVYECRDGRIARIEEHVDSLRFKEIVLDA